MSRTSLLATWGVAAPALPQESRAAAEGSIAQQAAPAPRPAVLPPRLLSDPEVPYPEGATGSATVILVLVVALDGSVTSATPEHDFPPFSARAAEAALGFQFAPALRDGRPVAAKIRIELVFREPAAPESSPAPSPDAATPASGAAVPAPAIAAPAASPIEIVVSGERAAPSRSATLTRAEVRELPGSFGDPFRAIEALPGVTPIVSGLPFFYVRGAPPGNAGYFLDGIRVPLLFHVGIGPSVVHPGLIERVDLYPGGYPARYGRFSGGIVAGETAAPRPELHGEYNLRLFDVGALAEAPFADSRGSVLLGGRYSYTAALLSLLSPETTLDYWDYQARVSYDLTHDDRIGVFAFGSYDMLGQKTASEALTLFGTEFHRVDLRYDRRLDVRGKLRTAFTLGEDRSIVMQDRSVRNRMAAARTELEYQVTKSARLRAGTDLAFDEYEVLIGTDDLSPSARRVAESFPSRRDVALGLRGDVVADVDPRLEVTPGLRLDLYGSDGETALAIDPRLALRTVLRPGAYLLTALGIAHQPPSFVVPVPGFQPGGLRGGLQRSLQESFGVELELGNATTATATVFHNAFFDMSDPLGSAEPQVNGCPPGSFPEDTLGGDPGGQRENATNCGERFTPGTLGPDRSGGGGQAADSRGGRRAADAFEVRTRGSAFGLELYLKKRLTSALGGYVAYTLSRSTRSHERQAHLSAFDRTHVANAALAYDLGRRWRAGSRLVFYTGLPKAQVPGDDSTRIPAFFRVDLRVEKRWQLARATWIALVAEWMNATLSTEAVTTTCTLQGCEAQTIGPVTIPSLGVEGAF